MTDDLDAKAAMTPSEVVLYEVLAARADSAETCLYFCRKEMRRMRAACFWVVDTARRCNPSRWVDLGSSMG